MTNMTKKQAKLLVDEVNNRVDGYTDNNRISALGFMNAYIALEMIDVYCYKFLLDKLQRHKHVRMSEMKPYIEEQVKA